MFVDIKLKSAAAQAMELLTFDVVEDDLAIAFLDMRGLPPEFNAHEVVKNYRQHGLTALKNLCLGYACIICDRRSECIIFSADSLGHTTFFYHMGSDYVFISDFLGDIQSCVAASINRQSFEWYLICGFVPGHTTIYENIYKLYGGQYVLIEKGSVFVRTYDSPAKSTHTSEDQLRLDLDNCLKYTVRRTLMKPAGVMLSGGFDSSMLCRLAQLYQTRVKTFTIGSQEYNQETLGQGMRMSQVLGTEHEILNVTVKEYLAAVPVTLRLMDEPILDLDTAVIYPALRKLPQEMKFLLHGFGSDQLIGNDFGYLRELSEAMVSFTDFNQYQDVKGDSRAAALFFIKEKMPQEVRLHYRLSQGAGGRLIFPFFEQAIVNAGLQMSEELRLNKKLLRSLLPSLNKILPPRATAGVEQAKGQIPETIKYVTWQVYGKNVGRSPLLQDLMGKSRLDAVVASGKKEDILKLVVFDLWAREAAGQRQDIDHEEFQNAKST
ncbi:MAG: hypothetical protein JNN05_04160 [Candidatus Omnitrophica bacterium]|nr:hypothetical protein [Candidatus Omnitrophota bacterium]